MNSYQKIKYYQSEKKSLLCVGLDSDVNKLPDVFERKVSSLLDFNLEIIKSTLEFASSYKINFAFYEQYGSEGLDVIKKTMEYLKDKSFVIADAKRGDIGNTSNAYAKSCFDYFGADAITVAPYMGYDSVEPFLKFSDKMTFILALTSNPGSADFQRLVFDGKPLFQHVIEKSISWGTIESTGFVTGATHPEDISKIRKIIPENYLLIPGVGTQGGDVQSLMRSNGNGPSIINVSRDIIYASNGKDFGASSSVRAKYYKELFAF